MAAAPNSGQPPLHNFPRRHGNSRTRRGERYDNRHKTARANAARQHHPTDQCPRCGQPLGPMNRNLHYDHDEHGGYLGFSHAHCNLRAGAVKGNRMQNAQQPPPRTTRTW